MKPGIPDVDYKGNKRKNEITPFMKFRENCRYHTDGDAGHTCDKRHDSCHALTCPLDWEKAS
jgi:hypothetical protein